MLCLLPVHLPLVSLGAEGEDGGLVALGGGVQQLKVKVSFYILITLYTVIHRHSYILEMINDNLLDSYLSNKTV